MQEGKIEDQDCRSARVMLGLMMPAPKHKTTLHFARFVKNRHLNCLLVGWYSELLPQEGEGEVLAKESYSHSWLLDVKKVHFSCTAVTGTGYSVKDPRLPVACITPTPIRQILAWKSGRVLSIDRYRTSSPTKTQF